jgi:hypothetical protein
MRMRDALGPISTNPDFAYRFPTDDQPAHAPTHLALITIMPFAEGRSDAQTADSVRGWIDGNYALAQELTDSSFDFASLSAFGPQVIPGNAEQVRFAPMHTLVREPGAVNASGRQRTNSTPIRGA